LLIIGKQLWGFFFNTKPGFKSRTSYYLIPFLVVVVVVLLPIQWYLFLGVADSQSHPPQ